MPWVHITSSTRTLIGVTRSLRGLEHVVYWAHEKAYPALQERVMPPRATTVIAESGWHPGSGSSDRLEAERRHGARTSGYSTTQSGKGQRHEADTGHRAGRLPPISPERSTRGIPCHAHQLYGGLLAAGNVTLLVGVEEYELEPVLSISISTRAVSTWAPGHRMRSTHRIAQPFLSSHAPLCPLLGQTSHHVRPASPAGRFS